MCVNRTALSEAMRESGNRLYTRTGDLMVYQRQVRSGVWPPVPWGTAACGLLALLVMGAGVLGIMV